MQKSKHPKSRINRKFTKAIENIKLLIAEKHVYESATLIMRLLQQISSTSKTAKKEKKEALRRVVNALFQSISKLPKSSEKDFSNFSDLVNFIAMRLKPKKGRRRLSISSVYTYFEKLRNAFIFMVTLNKSFAKIIMADLKLFRDEHPYSMRLFIRLLEDMDIPNIDFHDPSLSIHKVRRNVNLFPIDIAGEKFASLSHNEKLVVIFAYKLMMRESEIASVTREDLTLNSQLPGLDVVGKRSKKRFIAIASKDVVNILKDLCQHGRKGYIVCKSNGKPYTSNGIISIWKRAARKLGVPPDHIHFLRHLGINEKILEGEPLRSVSSTAGHSELVTTIKEYFHAQTYAVLKSVNNQNDLSKLFGIEPKNLTVKEAAPLLHLSVREIQYLIQKTKLKAHKEDGLWLIDEGDLLWYIRSRGFLHKTTKRYISKIKRS